MANIQQELPQPSKPSILEDLPAELKLEVIRACPNIETLLALISASSTYLSVYKANTPDLTFTIVALQDLDSRGVVLEPRAQFVLVRHTAPPPEYTKLDQLGLIPVVAAYHEAIDKSKGTKSVILPRALCRRLLTIEDAISFWEEIDEAGKLKMCCSRKSRLHRPIDPEIIRDYMSHLTYRDMNWENLRVWTDPSKKRTVDSCGGYSYVWDND